jgi:CubicO group peptidase (beta-lactamase class C family)
VVAVEKWLGAALDYVPQWLEYQMRAMEQPGVAVAIAERGKLVFEAAYGAADLGKGTRLTPRHRFRVASHSKSFTAAGIMKLREAGKLGLDDSVGRYVKGLHPAVAKATLAQLLSHSAGIIRDGTDSGQWQDRRGFLNEAELRAELAARPVLDANTRFKYSNHGFGLIGLVIEAVTGEPYARWIQREIVVPSGLEETTPDWPVSRRVPFARGHSGKVLLGKRAVIPGENPTNALAAATGFISTAGDLARFYAVLDPAAKGGVISAASRRELVRKQWRCPHSELERWYGLGITHGRVGDWEWFGHGGGFQGYITRTSMLPAQGLSVSVLTNAADGLAHQWGDGVIQILRAFKRHGSPSAKVRSWTGRWWSLWGAADLVPMGDKVLVGAPGFFNPFMDASELAVTGRDRARISLANGYASHGEEVRRIRRSGKVAEIWFAGSRVLPERQVAAEMRRRYRV